MIFFEGLQAVANIHPLIIHFPIGLLLIATFLFVLSNFITDKQELMVAAKWNLIIGALFTIPTVATGFMAAGTIPHNEQIHQAMNIHRIIMISTAILALLLAGYIYFQKDLSQIKKLRFFLAGLVLMSGLLTVGADYGGTMVFKYGAGTELFKKLNQNSGEGHNHHQRDQQDENKDKHNDGEESHDDGHSH